MIFRLFLGVCLALVASSTAAAQARDTVRPTIVLVHGAFAESSSWDGVIDCLSQRGFRVIAAAKVAALIEEAASAR